MKKLGLISDPHAYPQPVSEALSIFKQQQVDAIWCTGDIVGYGDDIEETINLLQDSACQSILGNHEIWYLEKATGQGDIATMRYLNSLPLVMHRDIEGKCVFMVHVLHKGQYRE